MIILCNNIRCTAMLWNFGFLILGEPYEVTCQVREGGVGSTLLIHLPAVNLETTTISCRKAPVATNLKHTNNCPLGEKSRHLTVLCRILFSTRLNKNKMVGQRNRYISNNSSSLLMSLEFILFLKHPRTRQTCFQNETYDYRVLQYCNTP